MLRGTRITSGDTRPSTRETPSPRTAWMSTIPESGRAGDPVAPPADAPLTLPGATRTTAGAPVTICLEVGIAPDALDDTCDKIKSGLNGDFLIITGGASVGQRDFVRAAIEKLGGRLAFWRVNVRPGKPVAFALLEGKPVFALPGNPVGAMVSFELFVRPSLLKSMGHRRLFRPLVKAVLQEATVNDGERPHLVRGIVSLREQRYYVSTTGNQSSGRLSSLVQGNGLIHLAPNAAYAAGAEMDVLLLDRGFEMGEANFP